MLKKEHYKAIFNNILDAIVETDRNGIIISCNNTVKQLFGYKPGELIGKNIDTLYFLLFQKNEIKEQVKKLRNTGFIESETAALHKDGHSFNMEVRVKLIQNENQETILFIGRDITSHKKVKEKLLLKTMVFEASNEGIIITDNQLHILEVNKAFTKITGYKQDEVTGKNLKFMKSKKNKKYLYERILESIKTTDSWQGEIGNVQKNGEEYLKWLSISAVKNEKNIITNCVAIFYNISEIRHTEDNLFYLTHFDKLTGVANKHLFQDRLGQAILHARRTGKMLAVLFLDLDGFKIINDTLGYQKGDKVLSMAADKLKKCVRDSDTIGRMGGDEFTIILTNLSSPLNVTPITQKIIENFSLPFHIEGHDFPLTTSIGITLYPEDGTDIDTLLKNAAIAMNKVKELGKNTYRFFSQDLDNKTFERMILSTRLWRGLEADEFLVYYQPQIDIKNKKLAAAESLVRWRNEELGIILPQKFIPLAEESGLILSIGENILRKTCKQGKKWLDQGYENFKISINLSGVQFKQQNLVEMIINILEETDFKPENLEFELTESILMENISETLYVLNKLKEIGFSLAIDDFGTGYSSLSYLMRFPINKLKIDKAFTKGITDKDTELITAIIALGQSLKMKIVAEGVENEQELEFLREKGCHLIQGYYFSPPIPANHFQKQFLEQNEYLLKKL